MSSKNRLVISYRKMVPEATAPFRTSDDAVGCDLSALRILDRNTKEVIGEPPVSILPGEALLFGGGIQFAVPPGIDCQLRPRSGLATKSDIELGNSPGTLDPDFRGEAGVYLRNHGKNPYVVEKGDRIVQLVFTEVKIPVFVEVESFSITKRNTGGFGSTGLQGLGYGTEAYDNEIRRWDIYFMTVARSVSKLSNCLRGAQRDENGLYHLNPDGSYIGATRCYGCIIVKNYNIVAQGFNHRTAECSEACGCIREVENIPSGVANDRGCLHAEGAAIQSLVRTGGVSIEGAAVYVNAAPCWKCAKDLAGCEIGTLVVPKGEYGNNGLLLLEKTGVEVRQID